MTHYFEIKFVASPLNTLLHMATTVSHVCVLQTSCPSVSAPPSFHHLRHHWQNTGVVWGNVLQYVQHYSFIFKFCLSQEWLLILEMKSAISVTTILVTSGLQNSLQQNGRGNAGFLYPKLQGRVTYMSMSPVEVFATEIKIFDQQKVCLIIPS